MRQQNLVPFLCLYIELFELVIEVIFHYCTTPPCHKINTGENGENVNPISEHRLRGSQLGRAMNLVDQLRTSTDERVLSGRRAVVIA